MNEHKLREAHAVVNKPVRALRTKTQRLHEDIRNGKVKYLHVSVLVKPGDKLHPAMRTPIGQGSTARKATPLPAQESIGKRRRAQQRLLRAAYAEIAEQGEAA